MGYIMDQFLGGCDTLKGLLLAVELATLVFRHICNSLKDTWY